MCKLVVQLEVCMEAQSVPQRQSIVRLVTVVRLSTACHILERQDFNLNNAGHDTDIPEVTLLITLKHLTGSKRLGISSRRSKGDREHYSLLLLMTAIIAWLRCEIRP